MSQDRRKRLKPLPIIASLLRKFYGTLVGAPTVTPMAAAAAKEKALKLIEDNAV
ncbi:hypothetical protein KEM54_005357, partial [Ascosphaera aggregata]